MNAKRLLAVALAALLVTSGVAVAAGVSAQANGETNTNATATTGAATAATASGSSSANTSASADVRVAATYRDGSVTLRVTEGGDPVSDVRVYAYGELVGTTDADGTVTFEARTGLLDAVTGSDLRVRLESKSASGEATYAVKGDRIVRTGAFESDSNATVGANATVGVDAANGSVGVDAGANASADAEARAAGESGRADETPADRRGPVTDVPARAADHVSEIHAAVRSFLSGGDGDGGFSLGARISALLGGGGHATADANAGTASASAEVTANATADA